MERARPLSRASWSRSTARRTMPWTRGSDGPSIASARVSPGDGIVREVWDLTRDPLRQLVVDRLEHVENRERGVDLHDPPRHQQTDNATDGVAHGERRRRIELEPVGLEVNAVHAVRGRHGGDVHVRVERTRWHTA